MANVNSSSASSESTMRKWAWVAIGLTVVSLGFLGRAHLLGHPVRWWSWALPVLVASNACFLVFGRRSPRAVTVWGYVSIGIAIAILVSQCSAGFR